MGDSIREKNEQAFSKIDSNKDFLIDLNEWNLFMAGHKHNYSQEDI
jgi:hypothetical protein